jgi:hypothetical protein
VFAVGIAVLASPTLALALGRQLHLGPTLGGFWSGGNSTGAGGSVGLAAGLGLTDAIRLYANLEYSLGADLPPMAAMSPPQLRHGGALTLGAAYIFDLGPLLPWVGLGVAAGFVATPSWLAFVPFGEARIGVDVLTSRYFGLTFQVAGTLSFANWAYVTGTVGGLVGLRWAIDL